MADRLAIHELYARYAQAADLADGAAYADCFTEDGWTDISSFGHTAESFRARGLDVLDETGKVRGRARLRAVATKTPGAPLYHHLTVNTLVTSYGGPGHRIGVLRRARARRPGPPVRTLRGRRRPRHRRAVAVRRAQGPRRVQLRHHPAPGLTPAPWNQGTTAATPYGCGGGRGAGGTGRQAAVAAAPWRTGSVVKP
ncbi:nuclear transport factor 2 family protein [Streptomyces sp. INA 01156]